MPTLLKTFVSQSWPPKPAFSVDQIPDLSGRVILVTGGNAGIGYETAKAVLSKNAKVYIACRSREKGENALASLRKETGKEAHFLQLDLARLASVKEAAREFLKYVYVLLIGSPDPGIDDVNLFDRLEPRLHILFNNAGVMEPSIDLLTADGYDLTVGTNVLGPYYFTSLVLPALLTAANEGPHKARIVNTSSFASEMCHGKLDYSAFKEDDRKRRALGTTNLYYISKWMNLTYTTEFSRRYKGKGIVSSAVNPGNIQSDLQRHLTGFKDWALSKILHPTPYGALTQLYAGTSEHADEFDGGYFVPWARRAEPNPTTKDPGEGKKLWEWLEAQVKANE
ncbi:short-chain alcohol dehydrogenase [Marasmius crinis-equi]|uniref:Short-chain alcohol dehydrogenase n=1 Tax=Marasmius crinis-equi TaxID=585013 RepID=A0ABR3G156_9AGAR